MSNPIYKGIEMNKQEFLENVETLIDDAVKYFNTNPNRYYQQNIKAYTKPSFKRKVIASYSKAYDKHIKTLGNVSSACLNEWLIELKHEVYGGM